MRQTDIETIALIFVVTVCAFVLQIRLSPLLGFVPDFLIATIAVITLRFGLLELLWTLALAACLIGWPFIYGEMILLLLGIFLVLFLIREHMFRFVGSFNGALIAVVAVTIFYAVLRGVFLIQFYKLFLEDLFVIALFAWFVFVLFGDRGAMQNFMRLPRSIRRK